MHRQKQETSSAPGAVQDAGEAPFDAAQALREGRTRHQEFSRPSLLEFARAFGSDLGERSESAQQEIAVAWQLLEQASRFNVAHAFEARPTGKKVWVEEKLKETQEKTEFREREQPSEIPAENIDIGALRTLQQLPRLTPAEWLKDEVAPEQFLRDLSARRLMVREYLSTTADAFRSTEEVEKTRLVEKDAPPEKDKTHGYVLLDRSVSMDNEQRLPLARAMSLAFFYRCAQDNAALKLRCFNARPQQLQAEEGPDALPTPATYLFEVHTSGSTDIQAALATAVADIVSEGKFARANILLISDGMSSLDESPLKENTFLHTLQVGTDPEVVESESAGILRSWSKTFTHLKNSFSEILQRCNLEEEVRGQLRAIPEDLQDNQSLQQLDQIARALNNLSALLKLAQTNRSRWTQTASDQLMSKLKGKALDQSVLASLKEIGEAIEQMLTPDQAGQALAKAEQLKKIVKSLKQMGLLQGSTSSDAISALDGMMNMLTSRELPQQLSHKRDRMEKSRIRAEAEALKENQKVLNDYNDKPKGFWHWLLTKSQEIAHRMRDLFR